jgi:DNA-binding transcriptional LysR family regulator
LSGEKSLVERTLDMRGLATQPVLTVGSTEAIKQAVIADVGVALVSRLAIRTEVAAGLLVELPVKGLRIRYPIFLIEPRGKSLNPAAAEFLKLLVLQ